MYPRLNNFMLVQQVTSCKNHKHLLNRNIDQVREIACQVIRKCCRENQSKFINKLFHFFSGSNVCLEK